MVVVGGLANRQIGAASALRVYPEERDVVRAFGRPIGIHQPYLRITRQPAASQFGGEGFAGGEHPAQSRQGFLGIIEHLLNQRGHQFQHSDATLADAPRECQRIVGNIVRQDVHLRTEERCREELPDRDIETLRSGLGDYVVLVQSQQRHLAQLIVEHACLFHHHPLGMAGGAGGIDHIGKAIGRRDNAWPLFALTLPLLGGPVEKRRPRFLRQFLEQLASQGLVALANDQGRHTSKFQQIYQPAPRQGWIERQIGCSRLEGADHHRHQFQPTIGQQGHRAIAFYTGLEQAPGNSVGLCVELAVGPGAVAAGRGYSLAQTIHLRLEQTYIAFIERIGAAPRGAGQQRCVLFFRHQRQLGESVVEAITDRQ